MGVVGGRRPCEEAPPPPSLSPGGLPRGGLSGGGEEEVGREGEGAVGGGGPPGSPRGDASGAGIPAANGTSIAGTVMVTRFQEASANLFVVTSYETITALGTHQKPKLSCRKD